MRAVAVPMADPQLEFHWIPDPGFLIQGFLIQCLHRIDGFTMENTTHPAPALSFSYRASTSAGTCRNLRHHMEHAIG